MGCVYRSGVSSRACFRRVGAALVVAVLAVGCGNSVPSPKTTASAGASVTPRASAAPTPAPADTLRVGFRLGETMGATVDVPNAYGFRGVVLLGVPPTLGFQAMVYSGLYRRDAHLEAIPDLADGPCVPQPDPKIVRCRLVDATFHDGTQVTADDVAYTYELWSQPVDATGTGNMEGSPAPFKEARAVDARTVDLVLSAVDSSFLTDLLTSLPILPRHSVEVAYADFLARANGLTGAGLRTLAAAIDDEVSRDPPVCTTRLDEVEKLFARLGAALYKEDFVDNAGNFDPCWYMRLASFEIKSVATALRATGLPAVAQAILFLTTFQPFPGSGPYRLVSASAKLVHLEAWPAYHGGLAATKYLDFIGAGRSEDVLADLAAGSIDVFPDGPTSNSQPRIRTAQSHALPGFVSLTFNVRPGRLFADRALRQALQLCIDLPQDVDSAFGAEPVFGPLIPGSWADDPSPPKPARDTVVAKRLIEASGWQLGADGIYAKGRTRLAARILMNTQVKARVKVADLIAFQARDCGMDLASSPQKLADIYALNKPPHYIPGTKTPFDLQIGGWLTGVDPGSILSSFHSSNAEYGLGGFSDPTLDSLLDAGAATYDRAERTRVYRQAQELLATEMPMIFFYALYGVDDLRPAVATADGPLDLATPYWAWQPERLVVVSDQ